MRSLSVCAIVCLAAGLLPLPQAAAGGSVDLVPIAYHPYPDAADPLGVPWMTMGERSWGYFESYYGFFDEDQNGFDFPSLVTDGVDFVEGAPGGDYDPTLDAYQKSFTGRSLRESPFVLTVNSSPSDGRIAFDVVVEVSAPLDERGLVLKWALVEDDVKYRPPPALSNGVFVHRFTARALAPRAPAVLDLSASTNVTYHGAVDLHPDWDVSKLYIAVWIQNEVETSPRFQFAEVPQATMHAVTDANATRQEHKAVLIEMFTATWCAACLFGDTALHTLATEQGLASDAYAPSRWTYIREPDSPTATLGAAVGLLVGLAVLAPARLHHAVKDVLGRLRR